MERIHNVSPAIPLPGPGRPVDQAHPRRCAVARSPVLDRRGSPTIASLNLPGGSSYVIVASADLGNNGATANLMTCQLRENGTVLASGSANLAPLAVFSQGTALTGASGGGTVTLACEPENSAHARSRVITALRVGTLNNLGA